MTSYDYKGYTISETSDGYYQVGEYEFPSFDEAMDWIDEDIQETCEALPPYDERFSEPERTMHKYLIYFAEYGLDQGSMMPVDAYSEAEAESWLRRHFDVDYITDIMEI